MFAAFFYSKLMQIIMVDRNLNEFSSVAFRVGINRDFYYVYIIEILIEI